MGYHVRTAQGEARRRLASRHPRPSRPGAARAHGHGAAGLT